MCCWITVSDVMMFFGFSAVKQWRLHSRWFYDKKGRFACSKAYNHSWWRYCRLSDFIMLLEDDFYFLCYMHNMNSIADACGEQDHWLSCDWWWLETGNSSYACLKSLLFPFVKIDCIYCAYLVKESLSILSIIINQLFSF